MKSKIPKVLVQIEDIKLTASELAEKFLISKGGAIHYFKHTFYSWDKNHYAQYLTPNDLMIDVIQFLHLAGYDRYVTTRLVKDIITALKGHALLKRESKIPFWLDDSSQDEFIPVKNGLLNLTKYINGEPNPLIPHTPAYFCNFCLEFDFDPTAGCPTFGQILNEIQPDADTQRFLQQWYGLNLVHDTSHEVFALFLGNGRDGKTTLQNILRMLVGEENYSTVPLEHLNGRFQKQQTVGKLANIIGEVSDTARFPETDIKSFVSGEPFTVEKKFQDPTKEVPTARITAAANNHPFFRDSSDGIWRREILIPFKHQVPKSRVNPNYAKRSFWYDNKEISGIFNWALAGLKDLRQTGSLTIPQASKEALEDIRTSLNPVAFFLRNHLVYEEGSEVSSAEIYEHFTDHIETLGVKKVSSAIVGREIKKVFPTAEQLGARMVNRYRTRSRYWKNIRLKTINEA